MNKSILIGRLTDEPKVNYTDGGSTIARLTLAVDRRFKSDNGPTADFIPCVAFGKTAEFLEKYFHKGNKIAIEGRIQTGSYEKDGQKVYTTDVVIESCEFVESKGSASATTENKKSDDFVNVPDGDMEELPF